jgi:hypothetical protein
LPKGKTPRLRVEEGLLYGFLRISSQAPSWTGGAWSFIPSDEHQGLGGREAKGQGRTSEAPPRQTPAPNSHRKANPSGPRLVPNKQEPREAERGGVSRYRRDKGIGSPAAWDRFTPNQRCLTTTSRRVAPRPKAVPLCWHKWLRLAYQGSFLGANMLKEGI